MSVDGDSPGPGFRGSRYADHFDPHAERTGRQSIHPAASDRTPDVVLRRSVARLASIGLYGVTAYNAGRRTNEIGIRMALGAGRGHVLLLVLRGAFGLIAFGLLIGLPLTFAVGRFLGDQLYGTSPYNPGRHTGVRPGSGVSALIGSLVPAIRASRISPLDALRIE